MRPVLILPKHPQAFLLVDAARGRIKIKGSGGIRDQEHFFRLIDMGIDRMGIGFRSTPIVLGLGTDAKAAKEQY